MPARKNLAWLWYGSIDWSTQNILHACLPLLFKSNQIKFTYQLQKKNTQFKSIHIKIWHVTAHFPIGLNDCTFFGSKLHDYFWAINTSVYFYLLVLVMFCERVVRLFRYSCYRHTVWVYKIDRDKSKYRQFRNIDASLILSRSSMKSRVSDRCNS